MARLLNRNFIIGVTGSIAAYKAAEITRELKREGANVRVIMTDGACEFITPLTLQALSGNPVHTGLLDTDAEAAMGHIELARWADALVIAPASADSIARLVQGRADDLLGACALATPAPVFVAPAMNQEMWAKAATQENIHVLQNRGITILGPDSGSQACGDIGAGRLLDPREIIESLVATFLTGQLAGKHVVITAGPTREPLCPVRYLSNRSSGKMGYALAEACMNAGARTTLISGPVHCEAPPGVVLVPVETTQEMLDASMAASDDADIFIGAAAVVDFRPESVATQKIKREGSTTMDLKLVSNPDIIASIAARQVRPSLVVGFAAETNDVTTYARNKLKKKRLDFIFANDVSDSAIGFNSDSNAGTLISADNDITMALSSKRVLAETMIAELAKHLPET
ncbi:MAG: bifunctional phosphopantothenoylcysteine decarboxylase/phosphopantothenate--cysteine ligase CoaBC [Luminiphilus sp.]|jgi:phosphopantothenoylcysteine decarboxylase/phosphopantothenate--cysteine ligase|nr:bifunctional phosphopantothenoylcysteine decarboxylase/phosphopantothenate--cysteine ligase CoaBC [Luminiphilus sp.]